MVHFGVINDLVIFKQTCSHQISAFCSCAKRCCVLVEVLTKSDRPVSKDSQINVQRTFIYEVKKTETVNAVWSSVLVETDDTVYIAPLPNPYERDYILINKVKSNVILTLCMFLR